MPFEEECINALNVYRRRHSADALVAKPELSKHAQTFANELAKTGTLRHSMSRKYGENLAMSQKKQPSGEEIAKMWYDEIEKYDFSKPGPIPGTAHFTQAVWKATTHVGVGIAKGPRGTYVVANFLPMGNVTNPGYFESNVLPQVDSPAIEEPTPTSPQDKQKTDPKTGSKEEEEARKRTGSKEEESEVFEETQTKKNKEGVVTEIHTVTTVKHCTDKQGRRIKEISKNVTTTTTNKGRKSISKKTESYTEFEEDGALKIK